MQNKDEKLPAATTVMQQKYILHTLIHKIKILYIKHYNPNQHVAENKPDVQQQNQFDFLGYEIDILVKHFYPMHEANTSLTFIIQCMQRYKLVVECGGD